MPKERNPLQAMVAFAMKNKVYPKEVRKFLGGLYATLMLTHSAKAAELEKIVYLAYKNGYELGAMEYGADGKQIEDSLPDLGIEI